MLHANVDRGRGLSVGNNDGGAACVASLGCGGHRNVVGNASVRHVGFHSLMDSGILGSRLSLSTNLGTVCNGRRKIPVGGRNNSILSTVGCFGPAAPIEGRSNS